MGGGGGSCVVPVSRRMQKIMGDENMTRMLVDYHMQGTDKSQYRFYEDNDGFLFIEKK